MHTFQLTSKAIWQCLELASQLPPFVCLRQAGQKGHAACKRGKKWMARIQVHCSCVAIGTGQIWKHNRHWKETMRPKSSGDSLHTFFLKLVTLKKVCEYEKIVRCVYLLRSGDLVFLSSIHFRSVECSPNIHLGWGMAALVNRFSLFPVIRPLGSQQKVPESRMRKAHQLYLATWRMKNSQWKLKPNEPDAFTSMNWLIIVWYCMFLSFRSCSCRAFCSLMSHISRGLQTIFQIGMLSAWKSANNFCDVTGDWGSSQM